MKKKDKLKLSILLGLTVTYIGGMTPSAFAAVYNTALGYGSIASADYSLAGGYDSIASADYSLAWGDENKASGEDSSAIGVANTASGAYSTAVGYANTSGDKATAVGFANTSGDRATAVGFENISSGERATAVGYYNTASDTESTAVGMENTASGSESSAIGYYNTASYNRSSALGFYNTASGDGSSAVGCGNAASGNQSSAMGYYNISSQFGSTAVGFDNTSSGLESTAVGFENISSGNESTAVGLANTIYAEDASAFGNHNAITSTAADSTATGYRNTVSGEYALASGYLNKASATNSTVLGQNSTASAENAVALGNTATASETNSIALGSNSTASTANSVALGSGSVTSSAHTGSTATGITLNGTTYTYAGTASDTAGTVSVGSAGNNRQVQNVAAGDVSATSTDAVNGSQLWAMETGLAAEGLTFAGNTGSDTVALGNTVSIVGSAAASGTTYSTSNLTTIESNGTITIEMSTTPTFDSVTAGTGASQVVIGSSGVQVGGNTYIDSSGINANNKTITNVAPGVNSTDAVNVSQLNSAVAASTTEVNNTDNNLTVTKSTDSTTNAPEYTVNLSTDITLGTGADAITINGSKGTITAGTGSTEITLDGVKGEATIGDVLINGSTGNITGLTNITWNPNSYVSGRAATEDELYQATSGTNGGLYFDADNDTASSGAIHKTLGSTLDIIGGYTGTGTTSATNVKTVTTADGKIQVQLADNANFTSVTTGNTSMSTSGVTTTDSSGNTTTVSSTGLTTKDSSGNSTSVSSTGLTTKDSSGNTTTVSGNGVSIAGANGKTVALSSTGLDNGGNTITNVAAGVNDTDAVNVSQLKTAVASATTTVSSGKNITVTSTKESDGHTDYSVALDDTVTLGSGSNAVKMDGTTGTITAGTGSNVVSINGTSGTITAGTTVSLDGVNGKATIGNVTINGSGSTGTVNGLTNKTWNPDSITSGQAATEDQLKVVDKETVHYDTNSDGTVNYNKVTMGGGTSGTTITNVAPGTISSTSTDAVNGSQLYGVEQNVINQGNQLNKLGDKVDKVGAGAAALAGLHPLDFDPDDKWDFALGYGHYDGQGALATGMFYRPNEDTMFSIGYEAGNGENMWNAGVTLKLGSGNHVTTSRIAMAKEIVDLHNEVDQLKGMVSSLLGTIDDSKSKAFPDVPENHWAYEYVSKLAGNGVVEGYPDGTFNGNQTMTRYEFAAMLYRAMQKGATIDGRLLNEFKPELDRIRVDTISSNSEGTPTIQRVRVIPGRG